jgi:hypothetical protein
MDNPDFYDQIMNTIEDFGNERYLLVVILIWYFAHKGIQFF